MQKKRAEAFLLQGVRLPILRDFRLDYILIRFRVFIHPIYNLFAPVEPVLPFLFPFLFARR